MNEIIDNHAFSAFCHVDSSNQVLVCDRQIQKQSDSVSSAAGFVLRHVVSPKNKCIPAYKEQHCYLHVDGSTIIDQEPEERNPDSHQVK